jgi:hypothetical protein
MPAVLSGQAPTDCNKEIHNAGHTLQPRMPCTLGLACLCRDVLQILCFRQVLTGLQQRPTQQHIPRLITGGN